ncbi:SAF domain protein [Elusimicrobium minutum Pei191]|uniref:SAF domain protein n=1 Tax=Elusimicrobium minutum (strain Pei191) TaxID=445932 RepID=B2KEB8_ELUMP|nr:SAF domain-containing protein [Elusimicrobium minutum]ACC98864.1 SAF domain protein [Elusimicrobium minutum Pei191]
MPTTNITENIKQPMSPKVFAFLVMSVILIMFAVLFIFAHKKRMHETKHVNIFVAAEDINKGTVITQRLLSPVKMIAHEPGAFLVGDIQLLLGSYALVDIVQGSQMTKHIITAEPVITAPDIGYRLYSLVLPYQAVPRDHTKTDINIYRGETLINSFKNIRIVSMKSVPEETAFVLEVDPQTAQELFFVENSKALHVEICCERPSKQS